LPFRVWLFYSRNSANHHQLKGSIFGCFQTIRSLAILIDFQIDHFEYIFKTFFLFFDVIVLIQLNILLIFRIVKKFSTNHYLR
jgi:hypothetical protein